jgi:hypothetical protein
MWAPHVGEISGCIECQLQQLNRSPNTLVTAAEMDDRGGGGDAKRWPWWAAASAAQAAAGLAWFRRGRSGTAVAMPFKAFGIASLIVGSGATAVAAGVLAAGVGSVRRLVEASVPVRRTVSLLESWLIRTLIRFVRCRCVTCAGGGDEGRGREHPAVDGSSSSPSGR